MQMNELRWWCRGDEAAKAVKAAESQFLRALCIGSAEGNDVEQEQKVYAPLHPTRQKVFRCIF